MLVHLKLKQSHSPDDKGLKMEYITALDGEKSSMTSSQNKSPRDPISSNDKKQPITDENQQEENQKKSKNLFQGQNLRVDGSMSGNKFNSHTNNHDDYNEDHSRNNILGQDEYDEDDEDFNESFDCDKQSMYSHVASQHPLSVDEDHAIPSQGSENSENEIISKKLQMTRKELAPICLYQLGFLICIIVPPLLLYDNCRTAPFYISHIIFLVLQILLFVISTFYHRRKNGKSTTGNSPFDSSNSLMRTQGRCCREILSQMKLIDTYTNLCFYSLVLNYRDKMPMYIFAVSTASIVICLIFKFAMTGFLIYFIAFKLGKTKEKEENEDSTLMKKTISLLSINQKTLTKILIWLDQDTIAKLYDPDNDQGESQMFAYHKQKYSYFKSLTEDLPMAAMQALYLQQEVCSTGLNSIIIISLYFNSVCILYALSNLCSSKSKEGSGTKAYKKEMERLRDYYEGNQARVIAEFYIEDQNEIQSMKMKALNDFLSYHEYDVQSFNFSTNQMSEETINYLQEIIVNSSESLEDLTLSRCRLKSVHISFFYYPQCLVKLNLSENRIGDHGAKLIANYLLEKNRDSLLCLNLEHNNISEAGASNLLKAIQQSSVINFNLKKNKGDPVTQSFSLSLAFEYFKVLQLNYIRYFTKKRLQVNGSKLQEQFMVKISVNESIDRVLLSLFKIDQTQTLRSLDLSMRFYRTMRSNEQKEKNGTNSKSLTIKGLQFYDDEQRLILLSMHYNANLLKNIPDNERQTLVSLQNWYYLGNSVTTINLSSNWFSQRAQQMVFTSLSNFINLKELIFNNNYIKNTGLFFKSLSECTNLESLYLKSCSFYGFYEVEFKTCFYLQACLKDLHLNYSNVNDSTIMSLADCLPQMKAIQKINLKQCGISFQSIDQIFEKLSSNHTIMSLNLSQNDLQGIQQLGKFIKSNKSIEKLKLSKTQLGDNELKQISYGLKINKSLQILDLSQNQIQNVGQIKEGLSCNIALEKLDISNNIIDDSGLIKLSQSLITNGCLETLSISFNEYQLTGLSDFFKIFEQNESLQNISFSIPQVLTDQELSELSKILVLTLINMKSSFKRLEILGNVKKLKDPEFFFKFIKDGAFNVEELIIDSILKKQQLIDIINALKIIVAGPLSKHDLDKFNNHKLKRITFIKPQEFSEEIQMLENLLEEKQNLFFLPQQMQQRFNRMKQQEEQKAEMNAAQVIQNQQQNANSFDEELDSSLDSQNSQRNEEGNTQMQMPKGNDPVMGQNDFKNKQQSPDNRI